MTRLTKDMLSHTPYAQAIGMRVVDIAKGWATLMVPYAPHLIGDPSTGVVAGGIITSLLDHGCGMATMLALDSPVSIATLDLRIDYMRAATPGRDLYARCRCTRKARAIAFVSGVCYHDDPEDPIATSVAAFMLSSNESRALKEGDPTDPKWQAPI